MSPARRYSSAVFGIAWRNVWNGRNPQFLVPALLFPLMFLIAFAGGLSSLRRVPGFDYPPGYTAFQYVFVLLQTAAFGGIFAGFSLLVDYESGFARRLLVTTRNHTAILVGYAVAAVYRTVAIGALVTVIAAIAGMKVGGDGVDMFGLVVLALLVAVTTSLFAAGVAFRLRTVQAGGVMQIPIFLVIFLAPVYVPLGLLRGWIHSIASINPVTALLTGGRSLLAGEGGSVALAFAVAAGLMVLLALYALSGLRAAEANG
jgi:ABC-2 type transport system permease protein